MRTPDNAPASVVQLPQPIAASGRLGVYIRIRGQGSIFVTVAGGVFGPLGANAPIGRQVNAASGTEFGEETIWEPDAWPAWHAASEAPTNVALVAPAGQTTVEVDCVIPFVTAP
jgi:hypothetical protein